MNEDDRKGLEAVSLAVDSLTAVTAAGLKRAVSAMVFCILVVVLTAGLLVALLMRADQQQSQLNALTNQLATMIGEQVKTLRAAEEVKAQVQEQSEQPKVEIRPAESSTPGKPQRAVVVITQPKKKPLPALPAPEAPAIEIPVKLPEGTAVK